MIFPGNVEDMMVEARDEVDKLFGHFKEEWERYDGEKIPAIASIDKLIRSLQHLSQCAILYDMFQIETCTSCDTRMSRPLMFQRDGFGYTCPKCLVAALDNMKEARSGKSG